MEICLQIDYELCFQTSGQYYDQNEVSSLWTTEGNIINPF